MRERDDIERKPCPGCNGARLIPYFGTLCSRCSNFPALLYPYVPLPKDLVPKRADGLVPGMRMSAELSFPINYIESAEREACNVIPFEPMSPAELHSLVTAMEQAEIDERERFERHRSRFASTREEHEKRSTNEETA